MADYPVGTPAPLDQGAAVWGPAAGMQRHFIQGEQGLPSGIKQSKVYLNLSLRIRVKGCPETSVEEIEVV